MELQKLTNKLQNLCHDGFSQSKVYVRVNNRKYELDAVVIKYPSGDVVIKVKEEE